MDQVDDILIHFGIPGMKWGRRKSKTSHITLPLTRKTEPSEDAKRIHKIKKKKLVEMSNAELKAVNERLQLERQYKELSKQDLSSGQKFVRDLIVNNAKQTVNNYVQKAMGQGAEELIKKLLSI